jgi:hypothetical protein
MVTVMVYKLETKDFDAVKALRVTGIIQEGQWDIGSDGRPCNGHRAVNIAARNDSIVYRITDHELGSTSNPKNTWAESAAFRRR